VTHAAEDTRREQPAADALKTEPTLAGEGVASEPRSGASRANGSALASAAPSPVEIDLCPHCKLWHDGKVIAHCLDNDRWTRVERDELREQIKRRSPGIRFAPSTARMQDRFGARNRADALAATLETEAAT
jgi:hypothetical protein